MNNTINYIKDCYNEFRYKVEFPKWNDLQQSTTVVAIATIILAIFLLAVDRFFNFSILNIYKFLISLK